MNNVAIIDNMLNEDAKNWSCPKKLEARRQTIIEPYKDIFGESIPADKQYWAMCGQCSIGGKPLEDCEIDQVSKAGLITPDQFHGVEINPAIHKLNEQGWPDANWYCGDFYGQMKEACADENFNPAIVNADLISMPDRGVGYFADIMSFLSSVVDETMLVANMVMEYKRFPDRNRDMEFVMQQLNKQDQFQKALKNKNWTLYKKQYYAYNGTGEESKSVMGSLIFYFKKG